MKTADVIEDRDTILSAAVTDAVDELTDLQGDDPTKWKWGKLHTLTLRNESFGKSGIGPIEWLFNRGPFETAGGTSVRTRRDGTRVTGTTWRGCHRSGWRSTCRTSTPAATST